MLPSKIALIDGDIILYLIGYKKKPSVPTEGFSTASIVEPKTWAEVKADLDSFMTYIKESTLTSHYIAFFSAPRKETFRYKLAVSKEYKGNRTSELPPFHTEMKNYLIEMYGFVQSEKVETDDMLASCQVQGFEGFETVICTIDKDMKQVPGNHWNWKTNEACTVTPAQASRLLWTQVLTGDSTDNIGGIPKVGPKTAEKILDEWAVAQYPAAVLVAYMNHFGRHKGVAMFHEAFMLVTLLTDLDISNLKPRSWYEETATMIDEPTTF